MNKMAINKERRTISVSVLLTMMPVYCLASLLHFIHNAEFISEYPNLPDWISASGVYVTWLGITSIGIVGYFLVSRGKLFLGLVTCGVYGAIGLDGLGHYTLAPISAHSFMMNFTIWLEATTAMIVLVVVTGLIIRYFNGGSKVVLE